MRELSAQPRAAVATAAVQTTPSTGLDVEESLAAWSSFCKGDAGNIAALQGWPCDSAHTRGGGGEPSRDDAEMERALEEKRGAVLNHCDLAQFHAVVAAALRFLGPRLEVWPSRLRPHGCLARRGARPCPRVRVAQPDVTQHDMYWRSQDVQGNGAHVRGPGLERLFHLSPPLPQGFSTATVVVCSGGLT